VAYSLAGFTTEEMLKIMYLSLISGFFFFLFSLPGYADFNIFSQRKIIIEDFSNTGETSFNYLGQSLATYVAHTFRQVPFIALSEKEKGLLQEIARRPSFAEYFVAAHETIENHLPPFVQQMPCGHD